MVATSRRHSCGGWIGDCKRTSFFGTHLPGLRATLLRIWSSWRPRPMISIYALGFQVSDSESLALLFYLSLLSFTVLLACWFHELIQDCVSASSRNTQKEYMDIMAIPMAFWRCHKPCWSFAFERCVSSGLQTDLEIWRSWWCQGCCVLSLCYLLL